MRSVCDAIKMNFDNPDELKQVDRHDMLAQMARTRERLTPPSDANATLGELQPPQNIVFMGLGGSAIAGDILADYARDITQIPIAVSRSLTLPAYVNEDTLFVAISYSGETRETLSVLTQAMKQQAKVVAVTSGGQLLSEAQRSKLPYLKLPSGILPRVALPELLAASMHVLESASALKETSRRLSEAREAAAIQIERIKPQIPLERNKAKQISRLLVDKLPLIVGVEEDASVLRRFKNELNENSKMPAFYYTLTEALHDDVEGLKALTSLANTQPIFIRNERWLVGHSRIQERLSDLLKTLGFPKSAEFGGVGSNRFAQLLTAVVFGDYVSVYLAALRGVDPSEMKLISELRKVMYTT